MLTSPLTSAPRVNASNTTHAGPVSASVPHACAHAKPSWPAPARRVALQVKTRARGQACRSLAGQAGPVAGAPAREGAGARAAPPDWPAGGTWRPPTGALEAVTSPGAGGAVRPRFWPVRPPGSPVFIPELHYSVSGFSFAPVWHLPGWFFSGFQCSAQGNNVTDAREVGACMYDGGGVLPSIGNALSPSPL